MDIRTKILAAVTIGERVPAAILKILQEEGVTALRNELEEMCEHDLADKALVVARICGMNDIAIYAEQVVSCSGSYPDSPSKT